MNLASVSMPIFFLAELITAQIFSFYLPDKMTVRRSSGDRPQAYMSRRVAIWIGPLAALLIGLYGTWTQERSFSVLILIQAVIYVAMVYLYVLNIMNQRRDEAGH